MTSASTPPGVMHCRRCIKPLGLWEDGEAVIEHGDGRLLRYDFSTGHTGIAGPVQFANGGPEAERRLCAGQQAAPIASAATGSRATRPASDLFIDNLPGLPDNPTSAARTGSGLPCLFTAQPAARQFCRLPADAQDHGTGTDGAQAPSNVRPLCSAWTLNGKVIANLQDGSSGNYSPVTAAREYGDWLLLWFA